jgi:uncharacterized protein (UPF0128 family)
MCGMAGHVECSGQNINAYRIMVGKTQGQTNFEVLRADGRMILKLILKKKYVRSWTQYIWVRIKASSGRL